MENRILEYTMAPSSVHRQVPVIPKTLAGKKPKKPAKGTGRKNDLFGLLKGWTIDSQAVSDELKE